MSTIGSSTIGDVPLVGDGASAVAPEADLSDTVTVIDEREAVLLNVLSESIHGMLVDDTFIANLLETHALGNDAAVASARMRALATDAVGLADSTASQHLASVSGHILAVASSSSAGRFAVNAASGVSFQDSVAAAWAMLLADEGSVQDDAAAVVRKLVALAETLRALGSVQGKLTAQAAVAVAAVLEGRVSAGWSADAVDQAALADEVRNTMAAMLAVTDAAQASDAIAPTLRMMLLSSESVTVADDPAAALRALEELADGAVLYCTIRLGGTDYQGWVLNTDLRAVTEYRNVPFDSFAMLGGRTYAAGDSGIFELAGDTDNGSPIDAWFRPFLTDFGAAKMKRVSDIWIGTSAKGLLVKVHTKDPATGNVTEDIYPVEYSHGAGNDKCRVKVGRGLTSHWWTLTVANVAGADFAIDSIDWKPLILDRRQ